MSKTNGFTVVELILVIVILSIFLGMAGADLRSSLGKGRDEERASDVTNIANYLDSSYATGFISVVNLKGSYPSIGHVSTDDVTANNVKVEQVFSELDKKNLQAPNVAANIYSLTPATNSSQTTAGILPQPAIGQYIYQPLDASGVLCTATATECRKFNIYYKFENGGTVYKVSSKNQ